MKYKELDLISRRKKIHLDKWKLRWRREKGDPNQHASGEWWGNEKKKKEEYVCNDGEFEREQRG